MELHLLQGRERSGYTTFGSVWSKGEAAASEFELRDAKGNSIPVQSKVLAWWPDKSIKWCTHTADAGKMTDTVNLNIVDSVAGMEQQIKGCLHICEDDTGYQIDTGRLKLFISKKEGAYLAENICINDVLMARAAYPVYVAEYRYEKGEVKGYENQEFIGEITSVELEEVGDLCAVFCFRGNNIPRSEERACMPFVIRMYLYADSEDISFTHTFLYDGIESRDYLKGMGIRFDVNMSERLYDRHIQYGTDRAHFHEAAVMLAANNPKLSKDIFIKQLQGEYVDYEGDEQVRFVAENVPVWNNYSIYQDSAYHYAIYKNTGEGCCDLRCAEGKRAPGVMAVNSATGGIMAGIKNFWQKYPSGLEVKGLGEENTGCTVWFYSPRAEAFDFRHYDKRSYPQTCYEGFSYVGASAYGIGVSSECKVRFTERFVDAKEMEQFAREVQKPPVYVGTPEYYHDKRAFGYWSLRTGESEVESWLEVQLDKSFDFYKAEIEARGWYGLFDYGDVMHTYDAIRHVWRYDFGGMAWQNTELVPTYWLWLYFLRTGREDVFTMMEAMSKHCSEVDVYHFGPNKGLGSRHNVRHWGCSCKEPRIAMAGHHRFLYYLTGDMRLKDIFEEVKDSDYTTIDRQVERNKHKEDFVPGVRSGPDWSAFVSNWRTWYEITLDERYRQRIETGIKDIYEAPYGLSSGPDYGYDVESAHLIYRGELENTPNQHLQICMGGPQDWWEIADMLEDNRLNELMADLGEFYYLDKEKKAELTNGLIKERPYSWPMFATGISGFSAMLRNNPDLARQSWKILIKFNWDMGGEAGYEAVEYAKGADGASFKEIPWNTTNTAAQWGLNVMMCLEFIRDYLPKNMDELKKLMEEEV